jgi:hypothetical protein
LERSTLNGNRRRTEYRILTSAVGKARFGDLPSFEEHDGKIKDIHSTAYVRAEILKAEKLSEP